MYLNTQYIYKKSHGMAIEKMKKTQKVDLFFQEMNKSSRN
jgi:hypothetical protein